MQKKVYKKWIKDIDELRARILTAWDRMDQRITGIDKAVRQWRYHTITFSLFIQKLYNKNQGFP